MIRPALTILLACILFTSCIKTGIEENDIIVQPDIVNNPIYTKLNKQGEPVDEIGWDTSKLKPRTTYLFYDNDNKPFVDTSRARINRCRAYVDSGILKINIGYSSGFGGSGFNIVCVDNKYNIVPYQSTDQVGIEKPKSAYQIIKKSLVLNKDKYAVGDSVYGYVDFKLIENPKNTHDNGGINMIEERKITHIGKGYFRGKIDKSY